MIQLQGKIGLDERIVRLGSHEIRHLIEQLRDESHDGGASYAVIAIDCRPTKTRSVDAIVLEVSDLNELLAADWAHAKHVGWLSQTTLVVVLPNATPVDAWQYRNQIEEYCDVPSDAIAVYANIQASIDLHGKRAQAIPSIDRLLVRRRPGWKRVTDFFGAALGLCVASPVLILAALLIKATSRGPIVFRQERVGLGGEPFTILKLRTMRYDAEERREDLHGKNEVDGLGFKIVDDPRMTPIGRLLRRTSLDELPQLINVLRGEMSLVGPRPLPVQDWKPTELWMCGRHDVLPGITCTWQIHGRSSVSFVEWMLMDLDYVESHDFFLDLRLLLETVPAVLSQRGAS